MAQKLKEILGPQDGILSCEEELAPVFCKPKLIPLKSITVEKLERMQRDATEKAQAAKTAENDSGVRFLLVSIPVQLLIDIFKAKAYQ